MQLWADPSVNSGGRYTREMLTKALDLVARLNGPAPSFVIAEGADAHYGDMDRAMAMITAAQHAGADAIKFQHHLPDEEMLPDIPMSSNMAVPLYEFLKQNALTIDQHRQLFEYATECGITYLCTPFSWVAAKELEAAINLPAYKIGSGEFTDTPTLERIASFGKPMILSTGMSNVEEIDFVYEFMCNLDIPFALMNCTSAYPPSATDIALGFIPRMIERYPRAWIGHSDHMPGTVTAVGAIALGAKLVEKHVTIDPNLTGPDADVSITFDELKHLVEAADILNDASGAEKVIHDSEISIRSWARRSLVYLRSLEAGSVVTEGDIWGKRPGTGVPSFKIAEFYGRSLTRSVSKNSLLSELDFS